VPGGTPTLTLSSVDYFTLHVTLPDSAPICDATETSIGSAPDCGLVELRRNMLPSFRRDASGKMTE
jgi:hypothetical protein